ncbi:MAG: hypothetical protein HOP31_12910 [Ignavibacteria bacterium]|nr:hypothetical protein [Ignavibacteria bacterium]
MSKKQPNNNNKPKVTDTKSQKLPSGLHKLDTQEINKTLLTIQTITDNLKTEDFEYLKKNIQLTDDNRRKEIIDSLTKLLVLGANVTLEAFLVVHDLDRTFARIGNAAIIFADNEKSAIEIFKKDNRINTRTANVRAYSIKDQQNNFYYYEPK